MLQKLVELYDLGVEKIRMIDFVVPLAFRLILAPVMAVAGYHKLNLHKMGDEGVSFFQALGPDENVAAWFGNPDWGLGMPAPEFMAFMAGWTELIGGILIFIGLAARFMSIPLAVTMLVAALTAHADSGWFAIAPTNADTSASQFYNVLGFDAAKESLTYSAEAGERLNAAKSLLRENGNYSWLTGKGNLVILQNGMEFAITYFFMFLTILFMGAGRFVSADYWLKKFVFEKH
jgi:uncharacterized membrane protein YphA (DoxX/SURF4 family)